MSEQNAFEEMPMDEGVDIAAIFGSAATGGDANPFAATPTPGSAAEQPPVSTAGDGLTMQPAMVFQNAEEAPAAPPLAQPTVVEPIPTAPKAAEINPLQAAVEAQEEKMHQAAAQSLFEKKPVFAYGDAKDPIGDSTMTFEELRIAKADDFPELAEVKKVSWSVKYGEITKKISDPKGNTIQGVKEEIERSKEFLEALKKAKDKNPDCLVKPHVNAQNKGIASYKGVFTSVEVAKKSDKTICLIPAEDGKVYEMRKTEMGEFVAPKNKVMEFQAIRAGFTPALPLIPHSLLQQIISFFRCYMEKNCEFEALAHILWDREQEQFTVYIPPQQVSKTRVEAKLPQDGFSEERYLHYADIHSHNSMPAKFSSVDDKDERATRLYAVVGRLDQFFPDITVRMSCGGTYQELSPGLVFEGADEKFPEEWKTNVKISNRSTKKQNSKFWMEAMAGCEGRDEVK